MPSSYTALVSSDWSECLSPNGPFDVIGFHYPDLRPAIEIVFRQYTGNAISLSSAVRQMTELLPGPITEPQMDAYLDRAFATYAGVPALIAGCLERGLLFMINTTGMLGYFQRALAKALLPPLPALSAHPVVRFDRNHPNPFQFYALGEIADKPANTAAVAKHHHIPPRKIVLMGDSGGDGPHFEWGARIGASLVGCMVKPSLAAYCRKRSITMQHQFGCTYKEGESRALDREMEFDYTVLMETIEEMVS